MFRDQRVFRAILLQSPKITSAADVVALLPKGKIKEFLPIIPDSDSGGVWHAYYISKTQFTDSLVLSDERAKDADSDSYKYNLYFFEMRIRRKVYVGLAVPFSQMAVELFTIIDKKTVSQHRLYQVLDLPRVATFLQESDDIARQFSAKMVRFEVVGDSDSNKLSISGNNVFYSRVFARACKQLRGIQLVPKRMKITCIGDRWKCACECDGFGNIWVRVSNKGQSLTRMIGFFEPLFIRGLVREDSSFPLRRAVQELEESENA